MLDINPGLILWTIITFIIVLMILRATAWKPLLAALTAREEKIRSSLEQADRAQKEAERLLEENRRQLAQAEEQSQRVMREGRELGEKLKLEILDKANASSRHIIEQAKEEISREKEAALVQLRAEVSDLAFAAAGKLIDANLDSPAQRKLVDRAITEFSKRSNA
jgi:F-type H+-transporting ATPase subunit b